MLVDVFNNCFENLYEPILDPFHGFQKIFYLRPLHNEHSYVACLQLTKWSFRSPFHSLKLLFVLSLITQVPRVLDDDIAPNHLTLLVFISRPSGKTGTRTKLIFPALNWLEIQIRSQQHIRSQRKVQNKVEDLRIRLAKKTFGWLPQIRTFLMILNVRSNVQELSAS